MAAVIPHAGNSKGQAGGNLERRSGTTNDQRQKMVAVNSGRRRWAADEHSRIFRKRMAPIVYMHPLTRSATAALPLRQEAQ